MIRHETHIYHHNDSYWRHGYFHYDPHWVDSYWWYPHYGFTYVHGSHVPSPFYYYHHLPAYVQIGRVRIISHSIGIFDRCRTRYVWNEPVNRYDDYSRLDYAVDQIVDAFNDRRVNRVDRLISSRGVIEVELDEDQRYEMDAVDFHDLMRDLVEGTDTIRYRVKDVRTARGEAIVVTDHEFYNPWGEKERVQHTFGLRQNYTGYDIVWFRVDR